MKLLLYLFAGFLTANGISVNINNSIVFNIDLMNQSINLIVQNLSTVPSILFNEYGRIAKEETYGRLDYTLFEDDLQETTDDFVKNVCTPIYQYCRFAYEAQMQAKLPYYVEQAIQIIKRRLRRHQKSLKTISEEWKSYSNKDYDKCDEIGCDTLPDYCEKLEYDRDTLEGIQKYIGDNFDDPSQVVKAGIILLNQAKVRDEIYDRAITKPMNDCIHKKVVPSFLRSP